MPRYDLVIIEIPSASASTGQSSSGIDDNVDAVEYRPLRIGDIVRRGPDWKAKHGNKDGGAGGVGRLIARPHNAEALLSDRDKAALSSFVWVYWTATKSFDKYFYNHNGQHELAPATEVSVQRATVSVFQSGEYVERGVDWVYGDEDGGPWCKGRVVNFEPAQGTIDVIWLRGVCENEVKQYAFGRGGKFEIVFIADLTVLSPPGVPTLGLGDVVEKGPDWKDRYKTQDGGGYGHIIEINQAKWEVVVVWWENSNSADYFYQSGNMEIKKVEGQPRRHIELGDRVSDVGTIRQEGIVVAVEMRKAYVEVRWQSGARQRRVWGGQKGKFGVDIVERFSDMSPMAGPGPGGFPTGRLVTRGPSWSVEDDDNDVPADDVGEVQKYSRDRNKVFVQWRKSQARGVYLYGAGAPDSCRFDIQLLPLELQFVAPEKERVQLPVHQFKVGDVVQPGPDWHRQRKTSGTKTEMGVTEGFVIKVMTDHGEDEVRVSCFVPVVY